MANINDADFSRIKNKIENDSQVSEKVRAWIGRNEDCLRRVCEGIVAGWKRDAFLKLVSDAMAFNVEAEPIPDDGIGADEVYVSIRRCLNGIKNTDGSVITPRQGAFGGLYLLSPESPAQAAEMQVEKAVIENIVEVASEQEQAELKERNLEKNFYPLVRDWALKNGYEKTEITGGKLPGFKWENPDLIEVQYSVGQFTRSIDFGITCFEVKLKVEPFGVWQAAHYRKFSREVYIAFAKNEKEVRGRDDGRIFDMAVELGIGVLAISENGDEFVQIQAPAQNTPAAAEINLVVSRFQGFYKELLQQAANDLKRTLEIPTILFQR